MRSTDPRGLSSPQRERLSLHRYLVVYALALAPSAAARPEEDLRVSGDAVAQVLEAAGFAGTLATMAAHRYRVCSTPVAPEGAPPRHARVGSAARDTASPTLVGPLACPEAWRTVWPLDVRIAQPPAPSLGSAGGVSYGSCYWRSTWRGAAPQELPTVSNRTVR